MKNLIAIVEIPVADMKRAIAFYQAVLDLPINEIDMGDTSMGLIPSDEGSVTMALVQGEGYPPAATGTLAYLSAEQGVQAFLDKVQQHGGEVINPRTEISPEMGYFAHFHDSEGNRVGVHGME